MKYAALAMGVMASPAGGQPIGYPLPDSPRRRHLLHYKRAVPRPEAVLRLSYAPYKGRCFLLDFCLR